MSRKGAPKNKAKTGRHGAAVAAPARQAQRPGAEKRRGRPEKKSSPMWEGPSVEELLKEQGLPVPSYDAAGPVQKGEGAGEAAPRPWAADGDETFFTPPRGVSAFDKSVRLVLVLCLAAILLTGTVVAGYYVTQRQGDYSSETYEASMAYANEADAEAEQFSRPADLRLIIPGADVQEMSISPADNSITERAEYSYDATIAYTVDEIVSRWRGAGLDPAVYPPQDGNTIVSAVADGEVFHATVTKAKPGRSGSNVVAILRRPPRPSERSWFSYPKSLPKPPEGSQVSSKGGALGPSQRGRAYTVVVPGEAMWTLAYYKERLLAAGWDVKASPNQDAASLSKGGGAAYLLTRGPEAYTMNVKAMENRLRDQTMVVFIPF